MRRALLGAAAAGLAAFGATALLAQPAATGEGPPAGLSLDVVDARQMSCVEGTAEWFVKGSATLVPAVDGAVTAVRLTALAGPAGNSVLGPAVVTDAVGGIAAGSVIRAGRETAFTPQARVSVPCHADRAFLVAAVHVAGTREPMRAQDAFLSEGVAMSAGVVPVTALLGVALAVAAVVGRGRRRPRIEP